MPPSANSRYLAALRIVERLREHGFAAFFAGGCVRDLLLGVEPKDYDVATAATPGEVQRLFPRTEAVGASFGVVLVLDRKDEQRIATEVATFRHDGAYTDGRRPDAVRFSTHPQEDVERRDFTVNGLLLDALAYHRGAPLADGVLDFVGGRQDLADKVLRAIGDPERRFAEDKLRMLRAVRFAARLGFTLDPGTLAAIQRQAATVMQVSAERVRDELTLILTEGHARRGFELLDQTGLLAYVLPEVAAMKGVEQPPEYHPEGDVWVHTLMLLEHLAFPLHREPRDGGATQTIGDTQPEISPTLAWGMLLHDVGKPATRTPPDPAREERTGKPDRIRFNGHVEAGLDIARPLLARLRFSNDDTAQILALVQHHMQFGDIRKMKQSTLKRFLRMPRFGEHLALHWADVMSSHGKNDLYYFAKEHFESSPPEVVKPALLVTGRSLIAAGYKPGPQFKSMLLLAEDLQLEGEVHTAEEAMARLRAQFGPPPATAQAT